MHMIAFPLAALALVAADAPPLPVGSDPQPRAAPRELQPFTRSDEQCRDVISHARQEAGKPPLLEREPASPDKPYHIYAVDRRQDGCAVMVMHGDPADIRPLPARPEAPERMIPLANGR